MADIERVHELGTGTSAASMGEAVIRGDMTCDLGELCRDPTGSDENSTLRCP